MIKLAGGVIQRVINDGDQFSSLTDKLVLSYTVQLFVFFALLISSEQNFGSPIQCMMPAETRGSWSNYYKDYCYIQDKYRVLEKSWHSMTHKNSADPNDNPIEIPDFAKRSLMEKITSVRSSNTYSSDNKVAYYPWIPYILFVQAVIFLMPRLFWKFFGLGFCNGLDMATVLKESERLSELSGADREQALNVVVKYIDDWLKLKQRSWFGSSSTFLAYILMKWMCVSNIFLQFCALGYFIGKGNIFWGFELFNTLLREFDCPYTGYFPRIVMCTLEKLDMANVQPTYFQCLLVLNAVNEKLFLFLFFWLIVVGIIAVFSAMRHTLLFFVTPYRRFYTDSLLPTQEILLTSAASVEYFPSGSATNRQLLEFFIDYLGCDGMILLIFIANSANSLMTFEIAKKLWNTSVQPSEISNDISHSESGRRFSGSLDPQAPNGKHYHTRKRLGDNEERAPLVTPVRTRDLSASSSAAASGDLPPTASHNLGFHHTPSTRGLFQPEPNKG